MFTIQHCKAYSSTAVWLLLQCEYMCCTTLHVLQQYYMDDGGQDYLCQKKSDISRPYFAVKDSEICCGVTVTRAPTQLETCLFGKGQGRPRGSFSSGVILSHQEHDTTLPRSSLCCLIFGVSPKNFF